MSHDDARVSATNISTSADGYNYPDFAEFERREGMELFARFAESPRVASRAVDFPATRLDDGGQLRVNELWRRTPLVMEFGSFT